MQRGKGTTVRGSCSVYMAGMFLTGGRGWAGWLAGLTRFVLSYDSAPVYHYTSIVSMVGLSRRNTILVRMVVRVLSCTKEVNHCIYDDVWTFRAHAYRPVLPSQVRVQSLPAGSR